MRIKFLSIIVTSFLVSFVVSSCLDNDDTVVVYSTDATIQAFSINNIKTTIIREKDTIRFTVNGTDYPFNIDQKLGIIYNRDSLPVQTDVSKVSLRITTAGGPVYYDKDGTQTLYLSTDSIDFTKAVNENAALKFKVYSPDQQMSRDYRIWIKVHKQVPDSLTWEEVKGTDFPGLAIAGKQKAVLFNGRIYVFAESSSQAKVTSTSENDGKSWTPLVALNGIDGKADYSSVIVYDNKLFIVAEGRVYSSVDGTDWTISSTTGNITTLVTSFTNNPAASTRLYGQDKKLIGISGNNFVQTTDGKVWEVISSIPTGFPVSNFAATPAYLTGTNPDIERAIVMGTVAANDSAAVVWSILSNETSYAQLSPSAYTSNYCPRLEDLSLIRYDGFLYAFGGKSADGTIKAFQSFYRSNNNGIIWEKVTRYASFPAAFLGNDESFSYLVDSHNFIWIIWSKTGEVWKGRINRLGFLI